MQYDTKWSWLETALGDGWLVRREQAERSVRFDEGRSLFGWVLAGENGGQKCTTGRQTAEVGVAFAGFSLGSRAQKRVSRGAATKSGDLGERSTSLLPQPMMDLNCNIAIVLIQSFYSTPAMAPSMCANAMYRVCKGRRINCGSSRPGLRFAGGSNPAVVGRAGLQSLYLVRSLWKPSCIAVPCGGNTHRLVAVEADRQQPACKRGKRDREGPATVGYLHILEGHVSSNPRRLQVFSSSIYIGLAR
ncbi:hypothetical protein B0T16DRAFT_126567 [Cercophora newfieldiana]|uniref:Uncharacterized protein n=1 Tax=Cercophora newfieldiana TaxID=92897 RepID=A0AA40CS19_9PEZI|nr:hypothetical protein B0T16DRAFT_126567 [Cercophora newfieldiana]